MRTRTLLATLLLAHAAPALAEDGFKIVVHRANPVTSLTRAQVAQFFLKKTTRWPAGQPVTPVEPADDALHARFCERVLGKSPYAVKAYWNQLIFSGREVPPLERRDDEEVVAFVRGNLGAIGLVSAGTSAGEVKTVPIRD